MKHLKLFESYQGTISMTEPLPAGKNVIFFDGVCGLCNRFVDFVMGIDDNSEFLFSPLQGEFARKVLPSQYVTDMKSVVLLKNNKELYTQSNAVIEILEEVGGIWSLARVANILPQGILDKAYDMVAENRYDLFGKKEECRIPTADERSKFIP
jgi:predicted DCC family thiol-disulfide oxidoreductase YuxK